MRIRTRSYAAAFAAGFAATTTTTTTVTTLSMQMQIQIHPTEALSLQTPSSFSSLSLQQRSTNSRLSSARADTNTDTKNSIRKKSYGAPVVDSTLLRFISQQKKVPQVFREASVNIEKGGDELCNLQDVQPLDDDTDVADYESTTNVIKQKLLSKTIDNNNNNNNNNNNWSSKDPWMAQFASKNVAQLLQSNGDNVDEQMAQVAGDAVERYCVVRTAQRRIRQFLKERDTLWASTTTSSTTSSTLNDTNDNNNAKQEMDSLAVSSIGPEASLLLEYNYDGPQDETLLYENNNNSNDMPTYNLQDVLNVMMEYGLTTSDICVLLTHSPNLALRVPSKSFQRKGQTDDAETLQETLERSFKGLLMKTLQLRRYDARKVLRNCPGLLSVRGSKSALQVVTILRKAGVSHKSLARDKNALPVVLSRSPAGLFRLVAFLSSTAVRMPLEQIGPLLRRRVGRELMDALLPVPNTKLPATTQDAAAWSRTRFERQERIERTYASMTQTARILKAQIGTQDLSKVVAAYPQVLLLDAEKQILPAARYLMGGLGIWQNDLSGVLQLYPTLLGTKIEDLERVVSYVLTLGVDEDDLAGIFRAFPGLFALSVEDMQAVVQYLESIGVRDIGAFVTKLPPVLGYSVEKDLKPKWEFLKTVCLQPEFELKEFPAYFSYPFDRVIKTRFNYLAYKGISIRFVSMRIDTVLRFGDVDFATKVALDDDNGEAFRSFASQRGSSAANGAAAQKLKKKRRNNNHRNKSRLSNNLQQQANDLADLDRIFREPLRNKSLGNSLPSLKPSRPKRKPKRKKLQQSTNAKQKQQQQQQRKQQPKNNNKNNNNNNNKRGGEDGTLPCPA